MSRRVMRQSGGETAMQRAVRLAEVDLAGARECPEWTGADPASARFTGFVAGFLAAVDDIAKEKP